MVEPQTSQHHHTNNRSAMRKRPIKNPNPPKPCLRSTDAETVPKKVWFDDVEIREYPMILGDNPTTAVGIPVAIDWNPQTRKLHEIDWYEVYRPKRRHGRALLMSPIRRVEAVTRSGSKMEDIGHVAVQMAIIQKHRADSSQKGRMEKLVEGFQRITHKDHKSLPSFTRVPTEAPRVLSTWKRHGEQVTQYSTAAA